MDMKQSICLFMLEITKTHHENEEYPQPCADGDYRNIFPLKIVKGNSYQILYSKEALMLLQNACKHICASLNPFIHMCIHLNHRYKVFVA